MKKRGLAILGSTGSIGTQALEILDNLKEEFELICITANQNYKLLIQQAKKYKPNTVVITDNQHYQEVKDELWNEDIKVFAGNNSLEQIVEMAEIDVIINALVGYSGLLPTLNAIKNKKTIALANKETLVVAGEIVMKMAKENNVPILPIDSEHSAIFQCFVGEFQNKIEKIFLTASGGPFRSKSMEDLQFVTVNEALKHPNWDMGAKITIDSATMMNKGFEIIEAKWLFDIEAKNIEVVIHPQSIIHSAIQFEDKSIKAQLGLPNMKIPIQYALSYPFRYQSELKEFSFFDYPNLSFEKPDINKFHNLALTYKAIEIGNNAACILNASNEITNLAFRNEKISFLDIARINEKTLEKAQIINNPTIDDYIQSNAEARNIAKELIEHKSFVR